MHKCSTCHYSLMKVTVYAIKALDNNCILASVYNIRIFYHEKYHQRKLQLMTTLVASGVFSPWRYIVGT